MSKTPDRILRLKAVLERTGLSRSTMYREMQNGTFPKTVKIGARCAGWPESALEAWMAGLLTRQNPVAPGTGKDGEENAVSRSNDHPALRERGAGVEPVGLHRQQRAAGAAFTAGHLKHGRPTTLDAESFHALQDQNQRLKALLAESLLDASALKDLLQAT